MGEVFSSAGLFRPWLPPCCGTGYGCLCVESSSLCSVCIYRGVDLVGELPWAGLPRWGTMESAFPSPTSDIVHSDTSGSFHGRDCTYFLPHATDRRVASPCQWEVFTISSRDRGDGLGNHPVCLTRYL